MILELNPKKDVVCVTTDTQGKTFTRHFFSTMFNANTQENIFRTLRKFNNTGDILTVSIYQDDEPTTTLYIS